MSQPITAEQILRSILESEAFVTQARHEPMPAAQQRRIFGGAPFGRRAIRWNGRRQCVETRVSTISMDYDIQSYTLQEIAELVASGKPARKGYNGYTVKNY